LTCLLFLTPGPQAEAACTYTVSPASFALTVNGGSGDISVKTTPDCAWSPSTATPWVTFTPDPGPQLGTAFVLFTAAGNTGAARTGGVTIVGAGVNKSVTLTEPACAYTLGPPSTAFGMNG